MRRAAAAALTSLLLVLAAATVVGADHETSSDWEGSFDQATQSKVVTYGWSMKLHRAYRCDNTNGCVWTLATYNTGDTYVRTCEFLGSVTLVGDCSDQLDADWTLTSTVTEQHDPPTWWLRFCTMPGWGDNPLWKTRKTMQGPINDTGHRTELLGPFNTLMWGALPVVETINEAPFCGGTG